MLHHVGYIWKYVGDARTVSVKPQNRQQEIYFILIIRFARLRNEYIICTKVINLLIYFLSLSFSTMDPRYVVLHIAQKNIFKTVNKYGH